MITQEIKPSLESLQMEIRELKQSVGKLQALVLAGKPEMDRKARVQQAKQEVFSEYDSLLSELAK